MSKEHMPRVFTPLSPRAHEYQKKWKVEGTSVVVRSGRYGDQGENSYFGEDVLQEGKEVFEKMRLNYGLPVLRTWLIHDKWFHSGEDELLQVVPEVKPFEGALTDFQKEEFIAQSKSIVNGLQRYYADETSNNGVLPTDIWPSQFMYGSVRGKSPQLWLVDVSPEYEDAECIQEDVLESYNSIKKFFTWVTGIPMTEDTNESEITDEDIKMFKIESKRLVELRKQFISDKTETHVHPDAKSAII